MRGKHAEKETRDGKWTEDIHEQDHRTSRAGVKHLCMLIKETTEQRIQDRRLSWSVLFGRPLTPMQYTRSEPFLSGDNPFSTSDSDSGLNSGSYSGGWPSSSKLSFASAPLRQFRRWNCLGSEASRLVCSIKVQGCQGLDCWWVQSDGPNCSQESI
jgi:hypothetical protein